jgi:hypothetical protein
LKIHLARLCVQIHFQKLLTRASASGVAKATALFVRHLPPVGQWQSLRQHGRSSQKTAYQIYCNVPTQKAAKRRPKKAAAKSSSNSLHQLIKYLDQL